MSARVIKFSKARIVTLRNIERVWRLREQALEHIRATEDLREQMEQLPHVWGILPDQVDRYLCDVEGMLTPHPLDEHEEKDWEGEDLRQWRDWQVFQKANGISL